jgi:hypothetical protein
MAQAYDTHAFLPGQRLYTPRAGEHDDLLPRDGSRPMIGDLVLANNLPTLDLHATSRRWVLDQLEHLLAGLIYIGFYDCTQSTGSYNPTSGISDGPLPDAELVMLGWFVVVVAQGIPSGDPNAPQVFSNIGDQFICDGSSWQRLAVGVTDVIAPNVALAPDLNGWGNVQVAIENLVNKAGDTMTGTLFFRRSPINPNFIEINPNGGVIVRTGGFVATPLLDITEEGVATGISFTSEGLANQNGRLYKRAGGGLVIRATVGGQQPEIESNDATTSGRIIDSRGGVMDGELTFHRDTTNFGLHFDDANGDVAWIYSDSNRNFLFRVSTTGQTGNQFLMRSRAGDLSIPGDPPRLFLYGQPVEPNDAVTKAYVDGLIGEGAFQHTYQLDELNLNLVEVPAFKPGYYGLVEGRAYTNLPPGMVLANDMLLGLYSTDETNPSSHCMQALTDPATPKIWFRVRGTFWSNWQAANYIFESRGVFTGNIDFLQEAGGYLNGCWQIPLGNNVGTPYNANWLLIQYSANGIQLQELFEMPPVGSPGLAVVSKWRRQRTGATWGIWELVAPSVLRSGDTMTGPLILSPDPIVEPLQAATREYVDQVASSSQVLVGVMINLNGTCNFTPSSGIPSPGLLPPAAPVNRGRYVVSQVAGIVTGGPVAGSVIDIGDWVASDGTIWFVLEVGGSDFVHKAGDTMTGSLAVNFAGDAVSANNLVTGERIVLNPNHLLQANAANPFGLWLFIGPSGDWYVRNVATAAQFQITDLVRGRVRGAVPPGGTIGQILIKNAALDYEMEWADPPDAPNIGDDATYFRDRGFVSSWDDAPMGASSVNGSGIGWPAGTGAYVRFTYPSTGGGINDYITQEAYYLGPSGDTIISRHVRIKHGVVWGGWVELALAPPNLVPLATIIYVDAQDALRLALLGGTMQGPLMLSRDPQGPMEAVTRQYIDRLVTAAPLLIGAVDAATGQCTFIDSSTGPVPPANRSGEYLICINAGTIPAGPAAGIVLVRGDWLFDNGTAWFRVQVGSAGTATTADQVALVPTIFGLSNVQAALQRISTGFTMQAAAIITRINTPDNNSRGTLSFGTAAFDHFHIFRNNGASTLSIDRFPTDGGAAVGVLGISRATGEISISSAPIVFWQNPANPPSATARSTGTRLVVWPGNPGQDFGIGIESGALWYNVGQTSNIHKFYVAAVEKIRIANADTIIYNNVKVGQTVGGMHIRVNNGTNSGFAQLQGGSGNACGIVEFFDNASVRRGFIGWRNAGSSTTNCLLIHSEGGWKFKIDDGLDGPLVIRVVNNSNVWNQKQLCVAHDNGTGAATPTAGEAGIAFYNYNNPANGDLRKASIILQRSVSNNNRNGFRFIDGDNNQLCNIAAASYNSTFDVGSPYSAYADKEQNEVDLVKVIEKLIVELTGVKNRLAAAEAKANALEIKVNKIERLKHTRK